MSYQDVRHHYDQQDDPEAPACPEFVKLENRLGLLEEELSEVVFDNETESPLIRGTPALPEITARLVKACQSGLRTMQAVRPAPGGVNSECLTAVNEAISEIAAVLRTVYRT